MVLGRCRKQPVNYRKIMIHRSFRLCGQNSPALGNASVNREYSVRKTYGQSPHQPSFQFDLSCRILQQGNSFPYLAQCKHTQKEQLLVCSFNPRDHFGCRLRFYKLGNDAGIKEKSTHRSTARPKSGLRFKSSPAPARGDSAKNCTRLWGCFARSVSLLYCSIGKITTSSLPCFVITWGPFARARRMTSLNCALAAWSCHVAVSELRVLVRLGFSLGTDTAFTPS